MAAGDTLLSRRSAVGFGEIEGVSPRTHGYFGGEGWNLDGFVTSVAVTPLPLRGVRVFPGGADSAGSGGLGKYSRAPFAGGS